MSDNIRTIESEPIVSPDILNIFSFQKRFRLGVSSIEPVKLLNSDDYLFNLTDELDLDDLEQFYKDLFDTPLYYDTISKKSIAPPIRPRKSTTPATLISTDAISFVPPTSRALSQSHRSTTTYILLILIALIICIIMAIFFIRIYNASDKSSITSPVPTQIPASTPIASTWLDGIKDSSFIYPATMMEITSPLGKKSITSEYSAVVISALSEYMFFCLSQILQKHNVQFTYYKNGESINFIIFLDAFNRNQILRALRYYNISYAGDRG